MALPPSFQGGSRVSPLSSRRRQVDGDEVARVVYFVKLHGVKSGTFTRDDRIILPLIYSCVARSPLAHGTGCLTPVADRSSLAVPQR